MVSREHLYLLMAKCHEMGQHISRLNFINPEENQLRDELVNYSQSIYTLHIDRVNRENRDFHARMTIFVMELMSCLIEFHDNPINQELQYVVKKLAAEWKVDLGSNIILFAHGNYAVRHYPEAYFSILTKLYLQSFSKRPRIVYLPREYDGDVIFSSVVFHEVGHMVENDRSLGGKVYDELIKIISNPRSTILKNYFRADYDKPGINEDRFRAYIKEYISDLFACQYLGKNILHFLNCYEALSRKVDTSDHPCYESREKMVESFMNYMSSNPHSTSDTFLQIIVNVFHNEAAIPDLGFRDLNLSKDAFLHGNRLALTNLSELFSSFSASWRASLSGLNAVETARGMAHGTLSRYDYYNSINQAIKQSIADFMVNNP